MDSDSARFPSRSPVISHNSLIHQLKNTHIDNFDIEEFQRLEDDLSSKFPDIKVTKSTIPLESFVGLEEVKRAIFQKLECHGRGINTRRTLEERILLFGATGTGKTHLVHAIANYLHANLVTLESCMVLQKWAQNMEMYTKVIYHLCQKNGGGPAVLYLDHLENFHLEIDKQKRNLVRFILGVQLTWKKIQKEEHAENYSQLSILATTYQPFLLDENVVFSFRQRIYVPTLNLKERKEMFEKTIQKTWKLGHVMQPTDVDWVARRSYGILTSEIKTVIQRAIEVQYPRWPKLEKIMEKGGRLRDDYEWRALRIDDFEWVIGGFLYLNSKCFFEFETFQRDYGTGPFMQINEREDYDENGQGKKGKKKNSWVWRTISWIF